MKRLWRAAITNSSMGKIDAGTFLLMDKRNTQWLVQDDGGHPRWMHSTGHPTWQRKSSSSHCFLIQGLPGWHESKEVGCWGIDYTMVLLKKNTKIPKAHSGTFAGPKELSDDPAMMLVLSMNNPWRVEAVLECSQARHEWIFRPFYFVVPDHYNPLPHEWCSKGSGRIRPKIAIICYPWPIARFPIVGHADVSSHSDLGTNQIESYRFCGWHPICRNQDDSHPRLRSVILLYSGRAGNCSFSLVVCFTSLLMLLDVNTVVSMEMLLSQGPRWENAVFLQLG